VFRDPILLRGTVFCETVNSEKDDVASPVNVLVYSHKDIGRFEGCGSSLLSHILVKGVNPYDMRR
jgi:hypothetical protein